MKIILILLVIATINACSQRESIESLISNDSYKYWLVVKDADERSKSEIFYYFDKNGQWLVFQRGYLKKNFSKLDRGDVYFIETWKFINDSTVDIGTRLYHIEKITKNEFIVVFKESGNRSKLIAVPDSFIPSQYLKMQ